MIIDNEGSKYFLLPDINYIFKQSFPLFKELSLVQKRISKDEVDYDSYTIETPDCGLRNLEKIDPLNLETMWYVIQETVDFEKILSFLTPNSIEYTELSKFIVNFLYNLRNTHHITKGKGIIDLQNK